jgi:ketosteroid isomerase-like protein
MDTETAARRWADTWSNAWPQRDAEAIAALYADTAVHHSTRFGPPVASGSRAAVEWWASWTEQGQELTYAGVSVLRFDDQGQVVEHRDYDHHIERRELPYTDW